ncbi:acyl-CoA thioesterase [Aequorivita sediminis]|uniref:acyl-CoA thioesterase n=1 Tax=Aequorivita sediminis TaxID=3073653 RepID=UPI0028A69D05|nr:thioesterase family protein [Aequorivita sp. F6058]
MKEFWHKHNLRVHYKQTDQMGVVHHANYVTWFEIGRTEMMRSNELPYSKMESMGLMLPVLEVQVKYHKPALYDEAIGIFTKIKNQSAVRLEFYYEARRLGKAGTPLALDENVEGEPEGELLASGTSLHMWLDKNWKPVRLNSRAPEVYELIQNISIDSNR